MPALKKLTDVDTAAILRFLGEGATPITGTVEVSSKREAESGLTPAVMARYYFTGYRKFLDPDGYPAIVPPWGTLNAIDLNTGKYLWKIPLGEYPELAAKGMKNTGSENYGGPVVTAGGLVFIAGTVYDRNVRAFDSKTGHLHGGQPPVCRQCNSYTYMIDGKQYVPIATSGARDPKGPQGAAYVAFALP
jgi:quinoprotein glucose dehydrogenase